MLIIRWRSSFARRADKLSGSPPIVRCLDFRKRTWLALLSAHVVQAYRYGLSVARIRAGRSRREGNTITGIGLGGLTQREAEVLQWVAGGKPNDDVARIIGATLATVKKHLERVYGKLGVANRTAASALYIRTGGIERRQRPNELTPNW